MRSEFRGVARLCRDRFLTADILASMPLQAGGVEPSVFTCVFTFCPGGISLFRSYMTPFSHRNSAGTSIIKNVR